MTGRLACYGYRAGDDGALVEHGGEQLVLEAVRELRAAGLSLRAVAAELTRRGLLTHQESGELEALRLIAELRADGLSLRDIADELSRRGVPVLP